MLAKDIKAGDTVDEWTVTEAKPAAEWPGTVAMGIVLLTLECTYWLDGHDVNGEEVWYGGKPWNAGSPTKTETRRTWRRADEEVE
jgi:hypothetical protein